MSSVFGGVSGEDPALGLNTSFLAGVTSTSEAIQILDQQLTIFNETNLIGGISEPLNTVINNINQRVNDIGQSLSVNLTEAQIKILYEGNPNTNAYTDAEKLIVANVGTYIDASELATALVPYRTSLDEDTINNSKLSLVNYISDTLVHPTSGGGGGNAFQGILTVGYAQTGLSQSDGTNVTSWYNYDSAVIDPYDMFASGVYFNGSNFIGFYETGATNCLIKEVALTYTNITPTTVFGAFSATEIYVRYLKVNFSGTRLFAVSDRILAPCIAYTDDGITWGQLPLTNSCRINSIHFPNALEMFVCSDIGITRIPNDFSSQTLVSTITNVNSIINATAPDTFLVMSFTGIYIWDYLTFTPATTPLVGNIASGYFGNSDLAYFPALNKYYVIGLGAVDNLLWSSTNGMVWTSQVMTELDTVAGLFYSPTTNKIFITGISTLASRVYYIDNTNTLNVVVVNDNSQDGINGVANVFERFIGSAPLIDYITVVKDGGNNNTINVFDTLTDLAIANSEVRASIGSYASETYVNNQITASQNTQNSSISSTYLTQANAGTTYYLQSNPSGYQTASNVTTALIPYYTSSQTDTAITNSQNTQNSSISSTYKLQSEFNTQFGYLLRPNIRIVVASGGAIIPATGQGYSTVESAVSAATSGQTVMVCPGTYTISNAITIPAGVSIMGFDKRTSILNLTNGLIAITMSSNTILRNLTINHTNSVNNDSITIQINDNLTTLIEDCVITSTKTTFANKMEIVYNSGNSTFTDLSYFNMKNCDLTVSSLSANSRCIKNIGQFRIDTCQCSVDNGSCVESTGASTNVLITNSFISGSNFDIQQTSGGIITLGKSTILNTNNITGGVSVLGGDNQYTTSNEGTIGAGASFVSYGANYTGNERTLYLPRNCIVYGLTYSNRLNTSTTATTITLRKNGVDTALTLSMGAASLYGTNTTTAIKFLAGDYVGIRVDRGTGTITDTNICFSTY